MFFDKIIKLTANVFFVFGLDEIPFHESKFLWIFENCENHNYVEDGLIFCVDTTMKTVLSCLLVTFYHGAFLSLTRVNRVTRTF